jgi:hypothetical protein
MLYLTIFEIFLSIFIAIIGLILLLLGLVWLLLPYYFRFSYAKHYDGSYEPKADIYDVDSRDVKTPQINHPTVIIDPKTGGFSINFGEGRSFNNGRFIYAEGRSIYSNVPQRPNETCLSPFSSNECEIETPLGLATEYTFSYQIPSSRIEFTTQIQVIKDHDSVLFSLRYNQAVVRSPANSDVDTENAFKSSLNPIFPIFTNESPNRRIFSFRDSVFCSPVRDFSLTHGPVVLFDDECNCILLSSLTNFFTSGWEKYPLEIDHQIQTFGFGIHRSVLNIPEQPITHQCIFVFDHGINSVFDTWSSLFRQYHHLTEKKELLSHDLVVNSLGYYTDNGAHYYYNTEKGKNGEETLELIEKHAQSLQLPFHYYHLDSWWYQKTTNARKQKWLGRLSSLMGGALYGGTLLWEPDAHYISHSLAEVSAKLGKPFSCHNRWFEIQSPYVSQFKFNIENGWAMPDDPAFWEHIMKYCAENKIIVYEQDWMSNVLKRFSYFSTEIGKAEAWLGDMANAAEKYRITIQYCMETPACLLYSMFLPAVTHCRTCDDYHGYAPHNYDIPGFTQANILAHAVGLRPFKDVFKTTKRGRFRGERKPELMALMAALSCGPVAPGDQIGYMNAALIMQTCQKNGQILQPDRPIMATDLVFVKNHTYYVAATHSQFGNHYWFYILTINLFPDRIHDSDNSYKLSALGITIPPVQYIEYDWHTGSSRIVDTESEIFQKLSFEDYKYRLYAPILESGIAIIGESNKFTMFSHRRIDHFISDEKHIAFSLTGSETEEILLKCYFPHNQYQIELNGCPFSYVRNSETGQVTLKIEFQNYTSIPVEITHL